MSISATEVSWIEEEIENLLACGHKSALDTARQARNALSGARKHNRVFSNAHTSTPCTLEKALETTNGRKNRGYHSLVTQGQIPIEILRGMILTKIPTTVGTVIVETNSSNGPDSLVFGCRIKIQPKLPSDC